MFYSDVKKIVEASNWWTSYVFVDFNKNTCTPEVACNLAAFLKGHSEYEIVLLLEFRLRGTKYI